MKIDLDNTPPCAELEDVAMELAAAKELATSHEYVALPRTRTVGFGTRSLVENPLARLKLLLVCNIVPLFALVHDAEVPIK